MTRRNNKKTILLTGANGYLGSRLMSHFVDNGYNIAAITRKLKQNMKDSSNVRWYSLEKVSVHDIFEIQKINTVIHTATLYGRNHEKNIDIIRANVEFPMSVLQEALNHKCDLFVNTDTILAKNINPYSMTKANFADWLSMYGNKIKIADLKLDHFYGPNDNPIKFIAWIISQLRANVTEINLTEGSQMRDFIYIDDVVSAFDVVLRNVDKLSSDRINVFEVGTNSKTSVRTMVATIKDIMGNTKTKLNFGAIPYRENEVLDYEINTTGLRLLGWKPQITNVEMGIKKLLEMEKIR